MLKAKDLPRELWGEAISTDVYILSRSSSKTLQGQTPHEKWTGRKPFVDHMRTFESIIHVKNTKGHLNKLENRSQPMLFIGYELGTKAYKSTGRGHQTQGPTSGERLFTKERNIL